MNGLALAAAAACLVVVAGIGVHLVTTTGLAPLGGPDGAKGDDATSRTRSLGALDALGARFVGLATRYYGPERTASIDRTLRRAGRPDGVTPAVYVRRQAGFVALALLCLVAFTLLRAPLAGLALALLLCGWMPLWLHGTAQRRQRTIDAELPDFLDVLGVTVRAGLSFRGSLERVCEHGDGPLVEEVRSALHEMSLGVPRRTVFQQMRERTSSESFGYFVTALLQAEELGVPMADALAEIAQDVRRQHAQRVRQAAAKAAPKVSLAVTMTIVPGALVLLVSAILLTNLDGITQLF